MAIPYRDCICFWVVLLLCWSGAPAQITAQSTRLFEIRTQKLSPEELSKLPPGEWVPVAADQFQQALKQLQHKQAISSPQSSWISQSRYRATLKGDYLVDGAFTAVVRNLSNHEVPLELSPLNLAMRQLKWQHTPARWGTTPGSKTIVMAKTGRNPLSGKWSLSGVRSPLGLNFHLKLPQATVSQLTLKIPDHLQLISKVGVVNAPVPSAETGWSLWTIVLGNNTHCDLRVEPKKVQNQQIVNPLTLVTQNTSYIIKQESLQFQSDFQLEVHRTQRKSLEFVIPQDLDINVVTYNDMLLDWDVVKGENRFYRIVVKLPDGLLGRSRPIRIGGEADVKLLKPWLLPRVELIDSQFLTGKISVSVDKELELVDLETLGCTQEQFLTTDNARSASFAQYNQHAQVIIKLGQEENQIHSQNLISLIFEKETWQLTAELSWRIQSGKRFSGSWLVPKHWQITEVSHVEQNNTNVIQDWSLNRNPDGTNWLTVNFPNSTDVGQIGTIHVQAVRPTPSGRLKLVQLPIFAPEHTASLTTGIVLNDADATLMNLLPGSDFSIIDSLQQIKDLDSSDWFEKRAAKATLLLSSSQMKPQGRILMNSNNGEFRADVSVSGSLQNDTLNETVTIELRRVDRFQSDQVFIYFSNPTQNLTWELPAADAQQNANNKIISPSRHNLWGLPDAGELWQITLPDKRNDSYRLIAKQIRPIHAEHLECLTPIIANARTRQGEYELQNQSSDKFSVKLMDRKPNRLSTIFENEKPKLLEMEQAFSWSYDSLDQKIVISRVVDRAGGHLRPTATCSLTSRINPQRSDQIDHTIQYELSNLIDEQPFQFQLSPEAKLISVIVDQQRILPVKENKSYTVPMLKTNRPKVIELHYHQPASIANIAQKIHLITPHVSYDVIDFEWKLILPTGFRVSNLSHAAFTSDHYEPITQWQRLLGPLGRQAESRFFNPLRLAFNSSKPADPLLSTLELANASSEGEYVWVYHANQIPQTTSLIVWDDDQTHYLAYLCVLTGLLIGSLCTLMRGKLIRGKLIRARGLLLAIFNTAGLAILISLWLSEPYALMMGGFTSGLLLASLLPRSLFEQKHKRADVPEGSTVSYTPVASVGIALLSFLCWGESHAQDIRTKSEPVTPIVYDVFVPHSEQPDNLEPTYVYVPMQLYQRLPLHNSSSTPLRSILFTQAEYELALKANRTAMLKMKMQVCVHQDLTQAVLQIPIHNLYLSLDRPCVVDGRPHAVTQGSDKTHLIIQLPSHAELLENRSPLRAPKPGPFRPTAVEDPFYQHQVELNFHVPIQSGEYQNVIDAKIPVLTQSHLKINSEQPLSKLSIPSAAKQHETDSTGRFTETNLGVDPQLLVTWSNDKPEPAESKPNVSMNVLATYKVKPTYIEAQFYFECRTSGKKIELLNWNLPANSLLQDFKSKHVEDSQLQSGIDGKQNLLLLWKQPATENIHFQANLLIPRNPQWNQLALPIPKIFSDLASNDPVIIDQVKLGAVSDTKYHILNRDVSAERVAGLEEYAYDEFSQELPKDWVFEKSELTYIISDPSSYSIPIQVDVKPTKNTLWSLAQTAVLSRNACRWKLAAEYETENSQIYQHHILLDERLKIDSIQVIQNEVDRLSHWSRDGQKVVLFLNGNANRYQQILISASEPLKLPHKLELPFVQFEQADPVNRQLTVIADQDLEVVLDQKVASESVSTLTDVVVSKEQYLVGRYVLTGLEMLPVLDLQLKKYKHTLDAAFWYHRKQNRLHCHVIYNLNQVALYNLQKQPLELTLSADFDLHPDDPCQVSEYLTWKRVTDGLQQKIIVSVKPHITQQVAEDQSVVIKFSSRDPLEDAISIPVVTSNSGAFPLNGSYLIMPSDLELQTETNQDARVLNALKLPEWIRFEALSDREADNYKVYVLNELPQDLQLHSTDHQHRGNANVIMYSKVYFEADGRAYGRTLVIAEKMEQEELKFIWPDKIELRSLVVNQAENQSVMPVDQVLKIPVTNSQRQYIILDWKVAKENTIPFMHYNNILHPGWMSESTAKHVMHVSYRRNNMFQLTQLSDHEMKLDQLLVFWNQLLKQYKRQIENDVRSGLRHILAQTSRAIFHNLANSDEDIQQERAVTRFRDEYRKLKNTWPNVYHHDSIGILQNVPYAGRMVMLAPNSPAITNEQTELSVWSIDFRVLFSIGILVLLILVCWLCNKYAPKMSNKHITKESYNTLIMLSLIWWWGAVGSVWGFCLLIISILLIGYCKLPRRQRVQHDHSLSAVSGSAWQENS